MIVLEEQTGLGVDLCQIVDQGRYDSLWAYQLALTYEIERGTSCSAVCAAKCVKQVEVNFCGLVIARINLVSRDETTRYAQGNLPRRSPVTNGDPRVNWPISFGPFSLTKARRLLERDGEPVPIGSRAFDILVHLLEHHGQVVSHRALLAAVWSHAIVEQGNLRFQVAALRKTLGNGEASYNYIVNVPGRGYCFTAPISRPDEEKASPPRGTHDR
jgi:DNA-binding winged helix-turn-helix (wHTH) protein